ncbi:MAG: hypothetical protein CMP59_01720 [Flavobacteriales bacterium]|nr:hypothetical protein [Flavobacteriales bacterium]|tara:strand:+ start:3804 stop:4382 length:579 start_codon:yes stop_codon:yes gene_type:complete
MKDAFSEFSSGAIVRKYQLVKPKYKNWRKLIVIVLIIGSFAYIPFLYDSLFIILGIILIIWLVLYPILAPELFPFDRLDQFIWFQEEKILLMEKGSLIKEIPISEIKSIRCWIGIDSYNLSPYSNLSDATAIAISFSAGNFKYRMTVLNELYLTDDDQSKFSRIPPNFYSTLVELESKYGIVLKDKKDNKRV